MADFETGGGDSLALGASSLLGQQRQTPPAIQLIQRLMAQSGQRPQTGAEGLLSFNPTPGQALPQVRAGSPDIQYANRPGGYQTTGERKRDEKAALFHGIASTVKTAVTYEQDKQVRTMKMDTEKLMNAIQGYNDAKAQGDQENAKHNADIINDMMGDPKKRKAFEKALNVNLLGEHKDKDSPEYKGFTKAYADYKSGANDLNPAAQALMKSQPTTLGLSPEMQAKIAAIKGGLIPGAKEQSAEFIATMHDLTTAQNQADRNTSQQKIAQMMVDSKDAASRRAYDAELKRSTDVVTYHSVMARAMLQKAGADNARALKIAHMRSDTLAAALGEKTGNDKLNQLTNSYKSITKQMQDNQNLITKTGNILTKDPGWLSKVFGRTPGLSADEKTGFQKDIMRATAENKFLEKQLDALESKRQLLMKIGDIPDDQGTPQNPTDVPEKDLTGPEPDVSGGNITFNFGDGGDNVGDSTGSQ